MNVEAARTATQQTSVLYRRLSLWALVLVLPVALWVAIGGAWVSFAEKNHDTIIDAPFGASFVFEGSGWRLESVEVREGPPGDASGSPGHASAPPKTLPPHTSRVLVRITVTPQDVAAVGRLNQWVLWLSDSEGRRWLATAAMRDPGSVLPQSCSGDYRVHPEVGKPFHFEQTFVVPTAVTKQVEPLIVLGEGRIIGPRAPLLHLRRS